VGGESELTSTRVRPAALHQNCKHAVHVHLITNTNKEQFMHRFWMLVGNSIRFYSELVLTATSLKGADMQANSTEPDNKAH
jgi:hypothetical protein